MDPRPAAVLVDLEPLVQQLRRIADSLERPAPPPAPTPPPSTPSHTPALPGAAEGSDPPLDRLQQRLFDLLRQWRRDQARMEGVPPYFVASDRSLREVARARPTTVEQLRDLRGFGPVKTAKYGADILEVARLA